MPIWTHLASHISSHVWNDAWHGKTPPALGFKLSCRTHHLQKVKGTQIFAYMEQRVSLCSLVICYCQISGLDYSGGADSVVAGYEWL